MNQKSVRFEARLFSGNRITIPKKLREMMGLAPGDHVAFDVKDGSDNAVYIKGVKRKTSKSTR